MLGYFTDQPTCWAAFTIYIYIPNIYIYITLYICGVYELPLFYQNQKHLMVHWTQGFHDKWPNLFSAKKQMTSNDPPINQQGEPQQIRYKWSYTHYKWPYNLVTRVISPL